MSLISILKAIAKSKGKILLSPLRATIIAIAIVGRLIKKQRNYTKDEAKKVKSDNFPRSNIKKLNMAIAILNKTIIR